MTVITNKVGTVSTIDFPENLERKEAASPPCQDELLPTLTEHFSDLKFLSRSLNQHAREFAPGVEWHAKWQMQDVKTYHFGTSHFERNTRHASRKRVEFPEAHAVAVTVEVQNRNLVFNVDETGMDLANVMRYVLREKRVYFLESHRPNRDVTLLTFHVDPFEPLVPSEAGFLKCEMRDFVKMQENWTLFWLLDTCSLTIQYYQPKRFNTRRFRDPLMLASNNLPRKDRVPQKQQAGFKARQRLVKQTYTEIADMFEGKLVNEQEYLRGDNVAFIQVKSPSALRNIKRFVEKLLQDESIEIIRVTMPHSRKRQGQRKGFLLYVECATEEQNRYLCETFYTEEFKEVGIKCKTAVFEKQSETNL